MPHVVESAASGRAKCRGCDKSIAKGQLRFGERLPNPFGDGEMTLWFHLECAACKRPEPLYETLNTTEEPIDGIERLREVAKFGLAHRRLPRLSQTGRAPTGRARCRSCRELIAKGAWRIAIVYYEEGRFEAAGFIHAKCSSTYFETADIVERIQCFSPNLSESDLREIEREL